MSRRQLVAGTVALLVLLGACSSDDDSEPGDGAGSATTAAAGDAGAPDETGPATSAADTAAASGEFSLLTYNVAGLPQEVSTENPSEHMPLISPLLEDYDIVLTQENFDWWADAIAGLDFVNYFDRLRADVTHEYRTEQHPGPEAVGIDGSDPDRPLPVVGDGLGMLSRLPFRDVVRVPWTHCFGGADTSDGGAGDCLAMKGFAVATYELGDGVEVDIYTLHAEAGSGEKDDPFRAEDFQDLAAFIAEHSAGRAVIVAGDTNLHSADHEDAAVDGPVWATFIEATGLTDVCDVVECEEPGSIDKVAFRNDGGVELTPLERRWEDDRFVGPEGEDLSDHPPVAVDWSWQAVG